MTTPDRDRLVHAGVPAGIAEVILGGWTGLTVAPEGRVVVARASGAPGHRAGIALDIVPEPGPRARLLTLALRVRGARGPTPADSGAIDLGSAAGRAWVAGLLRAGRAETVLVEGGRPAGRLTSTLGARAIAELRDVLARAGEWHAGPVAPAELGDAGWAEALARAPRLARGAAGGVVLVLAGFPPALLTAPGRMLLRMSAPPGADGPPVVRCSIVRGPRHHTVAIPATAPGDRELLRDAAAQHRLTLLAPAPDGHAEDYLRLTSPLGAAAREILRTAAGRV